MTACTGAVVAASLANNKASSTTLAVPSITYTAGRGYSLIVCFDAASTNPTVTVSTEAGTWTEVGGTAYNNTAAGTGVAVRHFYLVPGSTITTALTVTLTVAVTSKCCLAVEWTPSGGEVAVSTGPSYNNVTNAVSIGTGSAISPGSVINNTAANTQAAWGTAEGPSTDTVSISDNVPGTWQTLQKAGTTGGGAATNIVLFASVRTTANTNTWSTTSFLNTSRTSSNNQVGQLAWAGAALSFTGTAAITLAGVTSAASGTVVTQVTGTVARTLGAVTSTASGTTVPPPVTGTVAKTLGNVTSAAVGIETIQGTVARTLDNVRVTSRSYLTPTVDTVTTPDPGPLPSTCTFVAHVDASGGNNQMIVGQAELEGSLSWYWRRYSDDSNLNVVLSPDGSYGNVQALWGLVVPPPLSGERFLAAAISLAAGTLTTYTSPDGAAWTQSGGGALGAAWVAFDSAAPLRVGAFGYGDAWQGRIYSVELRSGLDPAGGTVLWRFDAAAYPAGATSWVDARGATWAIINPAAITTDGAVAVESMSGSLNRSLANVTSAASGTSISPVTGTAAVTLGNVTSAASGTQTPPPVSGTLSVALGAVTSAASGTEGMTGTLARTLGNVTSAASGTSISPPVTGTLARTLGAVTSNASGAVGSPAVTGTLTITLANVTATASGTSTSPPVTGTLARTLGNVTATATGAVVIPTVSGSLLVVLGTVTVTATGTVLIPAVTGTASITLRGVTCAASGFVRAPGEAPFTLKQGDRAYWGDRPVQKIMEGSTLIWTTV